MPHCLCKGNAMFKKILLGTLATVGLLALAIVLFKDSLLQMMTDDMFVSEDADAFDAGLPVGDRLPVIRAMHRGEVIDSLQQFSGERGLVVMVNRSVDWCPFCMRQAAELNAVAQKFRDAGLGIVMVSYDSPEDQQGFVDEHGISYPIVSDIDAATIGALGVLHRDYPPGDDNYGLAYPGTFVVAPDGEIVAKWFLEGYQVRIDAVTMLNDSLQALSAAL